MVSFAIIGMLYKILPFLVWFGSYGKQIGRSKVPALAEMYSEQWQLAGYWLWIAGLVTTSAAALFGNALVVRSGCVLLALSLAALTVNLVKIVSHHFHPQFEPLNIKVRHLTPALSPSVGERVGEVRVQSLVSAS